MIQLRAIKFSLSLILSLVAASYAQAATLWPSETPWAKGRSGSSEVRLILGTGPLIEGKLQPMGLEFRLAKDWHVYWKNPGEVGFPPRLKWKLPESWSAEDLQYTPPELIRPKAGGIAYGYSESVVYPFNLRVGRIQSGMYRIEALVEYLVCNIQCIPESANLILDLPTTFESTQKKSPHTAKLAQAFADVPKELKATDYQISWAGKNRLQIKFPQLKVENVFVFSTANNLRDVSVKKIDASTFEISSPKAIGEIEWTAVWKSGSSTLGGFQKLSPPSQSNLFEGAACDVSNDGSSHSSGDCQTEEPISFWLALLLAFIGGAILNLMPCVLPVVLIKTMNLLRLSSSQASQVRKSLFATTLGILASFLVLAFLILGFQAAGRQVGWGFHFQSPGFVAFMTFVIFVFSLNLFGVFEFHLSAKSTTKVAKLQRSPFLEGVFATLLATPCSAPFLGTALAFALAQPTLILILVFLAMGLGLSAPYLLLMLDPKLLKLLPKPGKWMASLKRLMALSLILSVVWLLYVLNQQTTSEFAFLMIGGLVIITTILFQTKKSWRWIAIAALVGVSVFSADHFKRTAMTSSHVQGPLSEEELRLRTEAGEKLFVVITADWCLTCKYNEKFVIQTSWFQDLLKKNGITEVVYDWTNRDDGIANFLRQHGRAGIPFSMLVSKDREVLLSELLTESNVRDAFKEFLQLPQ